MVNVEQLRQTPHFDDLVGFIPHFLDEDDPRPAKEQFNDRYRHGGGWFKSSVSDKFRVSDDKLTITYPGDPPYHALARIKLRDETIIIYTHAWVMILQKDGSYEIARMD